MRLVCSFRRRINAIGCKNLCFGRFCEFFTQLIRQVPHTKLRKVEAWSTHAALKDRRRWRIPLCRTLFPDLLWFRLFRRLLLFDSKLHHRLCLLGYWWRYRLIHREDAPKYACKSQTHRDKGQKFSHPMRPQTHVSLLLSRSQRQYLAHLPGDIDQQPQSTFRR